MNQAIETGKSLKEQGIRLVIENNYPWHEAVIGLFVEHFPRDMDFAADDLRDFCESAGVNPPKSFNCWGAVMNTLRSRKHITLVGYRKHRRKSSHYRLVGMWRRL